ncbi:MAG TPA: flagellar biosynthesis repressor FlbT [Thermodesulfovibrionales bacterium]|nr:flagellar biosynthesis repressor FlbT [Thermodesulfovibrionales bacterium]
MALKISLKPQERLILGGVAVTVIRNGDSANDLLIENNVPILIRGNDIMLEGDANSPCRKIYFMIQLMYLDGAHLAEYHSIYWQLVKDVVEAAPSTIGLLDTISEHILNERYYKALKTARQLINYEQDLMRSAKELRDDSCNLIRT